MPRISFAHDKRPPIEVEIGANLMQTLLAAGIPVASSCHGDGVCAKCRLQIVEGKNSLSQVNETELFLRDRFQLKADIRISCQVQVLGDLTVDATYW